MSIVLRAGEILCPPDRALALYFEFVIHNKRGKTQDRRTYGKDPFRPDGKPLDRAARTYRTIGLRLLIAALSLNHLLMHEEITFTVERDDESEMLVAFWDDLSGKGGITTQGADLKTLEEMVSEAVRCHFEEQERPRKVRLHFVTDPVLTTA